MFKKIIVFVLFSSLLSGCIPFVPFVMLTPLTPEHQLDINSEEISFKIAGKGVLNEVESWIANEEPSKAVFSCSNIDKKLCDSVSVMLEDYDLKYDKISSNDNHDYIVLVYQRVKARNCEMKEFGCSVSKNILHIVSNYSQFVNPPISDMQDSKKAISVYNQYLKK